MKGIHKVVVGTKYLKYEFELRRNLTVIRGDREDLRQPLGHGRRHLSAPHLAPQSSLVFRAACQRADSLCLDLRVLAENTDGGRTD